MQIEWQAFEGPTHTIKDSHNHSHMLQQRPTHTCNEIIRTMHPERAASSLGQQQCDSLNVQTCRPFTRTAHMGPRHTDNSHHAGQQDTMQHSTTHMHSAAAALTHA
ncbi:hypothetical protein I3760_07G072700 [Carya illinoinensis]|uniref:Uncharacterized protein n=1 Tax=Carya illinoinensis TaxID=32201 RepID=A0A922AE05_CARIL|nr:hypothetical protein I3760_07G072700 [Carya illinoinensis]KAG6678875.1 hypothetical protein I3842_14G103600 [Carya illinoinensis]